MVLRSDGFVTYGHGVLGGVGVTGQEGYPGISFGVIDALRVPLGNGSVGIGSIVIGGPDTTIFVRKTSVGVGHGFSVGSGLGDGGIISF